MQTSFFCAPIRQTILLVPTMFFPSRQDLPERLRGIYSYSRLCISARRKGASSSVGAEERLLLLRVAFTKLVEKICRENAGGESKKHNAHKNDKR